MGDELPEPSPAETNLLNAWHKAMGEAIAPRPKLQEMIDALEEVIVQKSASARVIAAEFQGGAFTKEAIRTVVVIDAAQSLLSRILENVQEWPRHIQLIVKGEQEAPKTKKPK